jgi:hypothetical protein
MRITVAVHGHFKSTSSVGQEEASYTFPDGTGMRIRDLLVTLNIIEEEVRQILLNGRSARLDEPVRHRIRLEFYPKERYRENPAAAETPAPSEA